MSRIGCSYHCRACGACSSSLEAFDGHRQFEEDHPGDWDHRVCIEPMDDRRFALKAGDGICKLARPPKVNARIWTMARHQQDWAQRSRVEHLTPRKAA
jgi:hypothetical protein